MHLPEGQGAHFVNGMDIRAVLVANGFSESQAALAVATIFGAIATAMAEGEAVSIRGFALFEPRTRPERTRKVPKTGEIVVTPPKTYVRFLPSARLKDRLNPEPRRATGKRRRRPGS